MPQPRSSRRWTRLLLLVALLLVAVVTSGAFAEPGAVVAVAAQDDATDEKESAAVRSTHKREKVPEFVPTSEWQELLPGQGIPKGLHVRLDMSTGKREAKLVDPDEEVDAEVENSMRSVVVDPESKATTVTVTTDLSGEVVTEDITTTNPIDDEESTSGLEVSEEESFETEPQDESDESTGEDNTNWNHEKIYETLQGLPEPPKVGEMDIHEAHEKLSPAEFRQQMIALWKKRQVELKDAIDNIQDDSKYFAKLIEQLYEAEQKGDVDEQLAVMEVLEWEVQDLDKTLVFNFIGGFGVMAERLNSTVLPIRAHAAWVVGSAAKNYHEAQNWVIDHGAVPKLISTLDLEVVNGSENVPAIIEAKKKALYALSVLVRANERGQRLFLLHSGPDVLAKLAAEVYPTNVQHKALLLAYDLLLDSFEEGYPEEVKTNLAQLRVAFRAPEWCTWFSSFFVEHGLQLPSRQSIEMMDALRYQLPDCQPVFEAADVKSAVATVYNKLAADEEEFDEEERQELGLFVADVLTWLDETEQLLVEVEE